VACGTRFFKRVLVKCHLRKKHQILDVNIVEEEVINDKFVNPGDARPFIHSLRLSNKRKHTAEIAAAGTS
jgi:hypothetical protein